MVGRIFRPPVVFAGVMLALALAAEPGFAQQEATPSVDAERQKTSALLDEYSDQVGQPQTLEELLETAGEHAPRVRRATERVGLGQAAIEGAEKFQPFNPEVEGTVAPNLGEGGLSRWEVGVKQRLEIFGQRGLRIDAAQQRKAALVAELGEARWEVHQRVHRLYRVGLVDQQRLGIERDILEFTQQLFQIAQERFEAGEEPRTSVIVARAEIAQARQRLVQAWMGYIRTLRDMGATIGWQQATPPQPTGELGRARPAPEADVLVEKAMARDPRLAVLKAQLEQARAELDLEQRKVWPNPLVGLGYEREKLAENQYENSLIVSLGVPLPLWDRNQGDIAAAQARIGVVRQEIDNRKEVLSSQVRKQAESVQSAYRQARIYQEEVLPALQTQLDLLQEGFKLGEMSLLDVMNARDRLLAVQRQYLDALEQYFVAVSELEQLLGTPIWDKDED